MEEASLDFKAYKACRVIEYRNAPRCPPFLYSAILIGWILAWTLRKFGLIKNPPKAGWCWRPAFYFDDPSFKKPFDDDIEKAKQVALTQIPLLPEVADD